MSDKFDKARLMDFHAYLQLNGMAESIGFMKAIDVVEDYIKITKARINKSREKELTYSES